jgi:tRNA pseudouridine(55) synthase
MKRFVVLNKNVGETPLSAIHAWKVKNSEYKNVPASYAGRLDPMASGKLLILLGDECKRQREYTNLDKEYEIEVLLDIGSDTGDVLGMPKYSNQTAITDELFVANVLRDELGEHARKYTVFSSKTVEGKPLFLYALEKKLKDIVIPEHIECIYSIKYLGSYTISSSELEERILKLLGQAPRTDESSKRLGEDFRVDDIRKHWESIFKNIHERNFIVLRLRVVCASGTYMRSLAGRIGESLRTNALALSISRTRIGKYLPLWNGTGFWFCTY